MVAAVPLVSYVTPFYNTEEYLEECIQSVLKQGYGNWEYILLNNCSTDRSAKIAEHYASQYPENIRLEHNPTFLSQVQNYNRVFSFISPNSKYCKFVQADDWLFPDCVPRMVELAESQAHTGIVSAYRLEGEKLGLDGLSYDIRELSGRDACRLYLLNGIYLFGSPTSLLLRSDVIRERNPFYEERYIPFEDSSVCFEILKNWNFGFVHQVLTFSRRNNDSILSRLRVFSFHYFVRLSAFVIYGRAFMDEREYKRGLQAAEREYFSFLARQKCSIRGPGPGFWDFHRDRLATIGYSLGWKQLWRRMPRVMLEKLWDVFWGRLDKFANVSYVENEK
jgi:glycosyltransferase involved in cell wall biosynthesis